MRQLFCYGGRFDNFTATAGPFVRAAGGAAARIALLFPTGEPGWDQNLDWYRSRLLQLGVAEAVLDSTSSSLSTS